MNTCEHSSCREPRNVAKSTYIRSVYVEGASEKLILLLLYKKLYPLKRLVGYDLIIYSFFIEKYIIFPITLNRAPTWYGPSWWSHLKSYEISNVMINLIKRTSEKCLYLICWNSRFLKTRSYRKMGIYLYFQ